MPCRSLNWIFASVCFFACSDSTSNAPPNGSNDTPPEQDGGTQLDGSPTPPTMVIEAACATAVASDGVCSLREAIANAVDGKQTHADCAGGSALTTVGLPAGCTFELAEFDNLVPGWTKSFCSVDGKACDALNPCGLSQCVAVAGIGKCTNEPKACFSHEDCTQTCNEVTTVDVGNALPIVTRAVVVEGRGSTLVRKAAGPAMRFFEVNGAGALTLKDLTLSGGSTPGVGGAIVVVAGTLTVLNGIFTDNASHDGGGAISGNIGPGGCKISVTGSKFQGSKTDRQGGAIQQGSCVLEVDHSTFSGNSASDGGGGVECSSEAACTVTNSTFTGNTASAGGGIEFLYGGPKTVSQSTFYGNTAGGGGAISSFAQAAVTVAFSTISGNTATEGVGGGIVSAESLTLASSVLEKNIDAEGLGPDVYVGNAPFTSGGYNHVESLAGGFVPGTGDVTGSSPNLSAPADNGGGTMTMAPAVGSPVVDTIPAGTNGCGTTYKIDSRGKARPTGTGGCDKGAVEL